MLRTHLSSFLLFVAIGGLVNVAKADVILSYGNATGLTANSTASGVTASDVSFSGLTQELNLSWSGYPTSTTRTSTDYVEWSFTSTTDYDLVDLRFNLERTSSGPRKIDVLVSVNGGGFNQIGTTLDVNQSAMSHTVILTSLPTASSATFRLHGFNASPGGTGQFYLRDHASFGSNTALVLNGTAVPEPNTGLAALLICLTFAHRRRL